MPAFNAQNKIKMPGKDFTIQIEQLHFYALCRELVKKVNFVYFNNNLVEKWNKITTWKQ